MEAGLLQLALYKAFVETESVSGFVSSLVEELMHLDGSGEFAVEITISNGMKFSAGCRGGGAHTYPVAATGRYSGHFLSNCADLPEEFLSLLTHLLARRVESSSHGHVRIAEAVSRVLGITFHDVRNTLGSISGISQLLEMDVADRPEVISGIHDIIGIINKFDESATTVMKLLRGQVLTYAHEEFSLSDTCKTILKRATRVYQLSSIQLVTSIQEDITCVGDEGYVKEIFSELLTNAATALDGQGGTITVEISEKSGKIEISVGQSGSPVLSEVQEYIFLPFFTTKEKGRGMGLTRIARYLKDWGGSVELIPTPEQPVRFVVTLPTTLP